MVKLMMLRGLPGCGKTTFAKQYQKEHPKTKRVNRDELRAMIDDSVWSKENESFIVEMEETIVTFALLHGFNVIVDDTNFGDKNRNRWEKIAGLHNEAEEMHPEGLCRGELVEFEVKEFTTSLEECIRRDSQRKGRAQVGKGVIMNFYNQHYAKTKTENKS